MLKKQQSCRSQKARKRRKENGGPQWTALLDLLAKDEARLQHSGTSTTKVGEETLTWLAQDSRSAFVLNQWLASTATQGRNTRKQKCQ